ncbi:MAG: glycosyltransferase family 4 protein [Deltaproteobacteria bacterium]|nr:glycosyltransferase family 4 protein [Deltaproteobacteria bacterium]
MPRPHAERTDGGAWMRSPEPHPLWVIAGIENGTPYSMRAYAAALAAGLAEHGVASRRITCRLPGRRRGTMTARVWSLGAVRYLLYPMRAARARGPGVRLVLDQANAHVGWFGGPGPRVVVVHDLHSLVPPPLVGGWGTMIGHLRVALSRMLKGPAIRHASLLLAVSRATRAHLIDDLGIAPERVRVAEPGVDHRIFRPGDRAAARRALALEPGVPIVLNVAAREPRKNEAFLLTAFTSLRERIPDARLVCVGREVTPEVRRTLAVRGLASAVSYAGEVDVEDLVRYYRAADVLAHPTRAEGSSLVALEAMAVGCPVVASRLPALIEVCGDAAELVPPDEPAHFAAALHAVLSDPERRRTLVGAGRSVAARATWSAWVDQVLAACAEVAADVPVTVRTACSRPS